jgi:hypothetical protein
MRVFFYMQDGFFELAGNGFQKSACRGNVDYAYNSRAKKASSLGAAVPQIKYKMLRLLKHRPEKLTFC